MGSNLREAHGHSRGPRSVAFLRITLPCSPTPRTARPRGTEDGAVSPVQPNVRYFALLPRACHGVACSSGEKMSAFGAKVTRLPRWTWAHTGRRPVNVLHLYFLGCNPLSNRFDRQFVLQIQRDSHKGHIAALETYVDNCSVGPFWAIVRVCYFSVILSTT